MFAIVLVFVLVHCVFDNRLTYTKVFNRCMGWSLGIHGAIALAEFGRQSFASPIVDFVGWTFVRFAFTLGICYVVCLLIFYGRIKHTEVKEVE